MVYSPTGSSDLLLIPSCMTSNFLYLNFSILHSSSLWRTDTIVFAKLNTLPLSNNPPVSIKPPPPPLNVFETNKPSGGLRGFTVSPICPAPVTGPHMDGWKTMRKQSELWTTVNGHLRDRHQVSILERSIL